MGGAIGLIDFTEGSIADGDLVLTLDGRRVILFNARVGTLEFPGLEVGVVVEG